MSDTADPRYGAGRTALRTALIMTVFTAVFTLLMAGTHHATRPEIEAARQHERMRQIEAILPAGLYDNLPLQDRIVLPADPALDPNRPTELLRARKAGASVALVLETVAPDGYAGRIRLAVAIGHDGQVLGVRALEHRETPGLGDYIDPAKDRNKTRPWINQFIGLSFERLAPEAWKVKKDGGEIGYRSGATITARAVTLAVARALAFANRHRDALFSTPNGQRFQPAHGDRP